MYYSCRYSLAVVLAPIRLLAMLAGGRMPPTFGVASLPVAGIWYAAVAAALVSAGSVSPLILSGSYKFSLPGSGSTAP